MMKKNYFLETYINENSKTELNISSEGRKEIFYLVENNKRFKEIFQSLVEQVEKEIATDPFLRLFFFKLDIYVQKDFFR